MEEIKKFKFSSINEHYTLPIGVLNILHASYSINTHTSIDSFSQIIVPVLLQSLGGPLIANTIIPYFKFSTNVLLSFIIGITSFFMLKRIEIVKRFSSVAPQIGKIFLLCDMKNSNLEISALVFWLAINSFAGCVIHKIITNKKNFLYLTEDETKEIFSSVLILCVARYFSFNDVYVAMAVILIYVSSQGADSIAHSANLINNSNEFIKNTKKNNKKKKVSEKEEEGTEIKEDEDTKEETYFTDDAMEEFESSIPKTPKRRGRPKKCVGDEHNANITQTPRKQRTSKRKTNENDE